MTERKLSLKQEKLLANIESNYNKIKIKYENQGKLKYFKYLLIGGRFENSEVSASFNIYRYNQHVIKGVKHIMNGPCKNPACIHDVNKLLEHMHPEIKQFHPKFVEAFYPELCDDVDCRALVWCNALHNDISETPDIKEFEEEYIIGRAKSFIARKYGDEYLPILPYYDPFKDPDFFYGDGDWYKCFHKAGCRYYNEMSPYSSPSSSDID